MAASGYWRLKANIWSFLERMFPFFFVAEFKRPEKCTLSVL